MLPYVYVYAVWFDFPIFNFKMWESNRTPFRRVLKVLALVLFTPALGGAEWTKINQKLESSKINQKLESYSP